MTALYLECLSTLRRTFPSIERTVPPPQKVPVLDSFVFRVVEHTLHQAIVQKLARVLTGLSAAHTLHQAGLFQEQGILQRVLDELVEDLTFLCYPLFDNRMPPLHHRYLDAFFMEDEADWSDPVNSRNSRPMIPRKKIRSYVARIPESALDASRGVAVAKTLHQAYSGFVHAASPHIMDMYGGFPPHFHIEGMTHTSLVTGANRDLGNHIYRGLLSQMLVAKAFGLDDVYSELYSFRADYEERAGIEYF